jgi:hypothetical protein
VGNPVSYTNKTDRHDTTEILLKVALNTITLTHKNCKSVTLHGEGVTVAGTKKETLDVRLEPTG